jgi:GNAT superfamily N-acetyltransferase
MNYSVSENQFTISTDKTKLDMEYVHAFLSKSYWSPNVPFETVRKASENSLCFGIYDNNKQVGYTRVITDKTTFGYLADVFIDENYRGKGLGKWLVRTVMKHPDLQGLRRIILTTQDAHKVYEQCGFVSVPYPERFMVYSPATV